MNRAEKIEEALRLALEEIGHGECSTNAHEYVPCDCWRSGARAALSLPPDTAPAPVEIPPERMESIEQHLREKAALRLEFLKGPAPASPPKGTSEHDGILRDGCREMHLGRPCVRARSHAGEHQFLYEPAPSSPGDSVPCPECEGAKVVGDFTPPYERACSKCHPLPSASMVPGGER